MLPDLNELFYHAVLCIFQVFLKFQHSLQEKAKDFLFAIDKHRNPHIFNDTYSLKGL